MDLKKFATDASSLFNRAKQYTEEKLGQAEKTEYDAQFESLLLRAERTKFWTEKLVQQAETVLIPDPATRMEAHLMDRLDRKKRDKPTPVEQLGQEMIDAGNQLGPGTSYGGALVKVGQVEQKIGTAEREMIEAVSGVYLHPLKTFLDNDMKSYMKERKILETKRLDLDSCKSRVKKASKQTSKEQAMEQEKAEQELRQAQTEFDRQVEITRLLLEGITSTHAHHLRCLHDFIEAQTAHYARCHQYLVDLQRHLTGSAGGRQASIGGGVAQSMGGGSSGGGGGFSLLCNSNSLSMDGDTPMFNADTNSNKDGYKARALRDYQAADMQELSLAADEEIVVFKLVNDSKSQMYLAQRGSQRGKVPKAYVQLLS